jgi:hypothetical protein
VSLSNSFSVTIATTSDPAWYTAQAVSQWKQMSFGIADTLSAIGGQFDSIASWNSAVGTPDSLIIAAAGGHTGSSDTSNNLVGEYTLNVASPRWVLRVPTSTSAQQSFSIPAEHPYYNDGKPAARHQYYTVGYIPTLSGSANGDRMFLPWGFALYGDGNGHTKVAASYSRVNGTYDPQNFFPDWATDTDIRNDFNGGTVFDPVTEKVYVSAGAGGFFDLRTFDPRTKTYAALSTQSSSGTGGYTSYMIDPVRRVLVAITGSTMYVTDLLAPTTMRTYTVSGLSSEGIGFAYEPTSGKWATWNGGAAIRVINVPANYRTGDGSTSNPLNASAVYTVTTITPSGGATPTAAAANGTFGRFRYIANPKGFIVVNDNTQTPYFYKIPSTGLA